MAEYYSYCAKEAGVAANAKEMYVTDKSAMREVVKQYLEHDVAVKEEDKETKPQKKSLLSNLGSLFSKKGEL